MSNNSFIDRIIEERSEVKDRLGKLNVFIGSPNFLKIDPAQQALLMVQAKIMDSYQIVLAERLTLLDVTSIS